jgi:hypothetical protein
VFRNDNGVYRAEPLLAFEWLDHGFGTRHATGWAPPERTATLQQIHSAAILLAATQTGCQGEGDALVTNRPGVTVAVRTADCVPVLLVDTRHRAVAAIHAGWRGTAQAIAAAAVKRMSAEFGSTPQDIHAAIGPAIGRCCYEVGPEVKNRLAPYLTGLSFETSSADEPVRVDLIEANLRQLADAGVPPARIYRASLCTQCREDEFFSYRRGRDTGRMVSAIALKPR